MHNAMPQYFLFGARGLLMSVCKTQALVTRHFFGSWLENAVQESPAGYLAKCCWFLGKGGGDSMDGND